MFHAISDAALPPDPLLSDAPAVMQRLAAKVEDIGRLIAPGRPVVYLDYPVHLNVGDLLIEAGAFPPVTRIVLVNIAFMILVYRSVFTAGLAAKIFSRTPLR